MYIVNCTLYILSSYPLTAPPTSPLITYFWAVTKIIIGGVTSIQPYAIIQFQRIPYSFVRLYIAVVIGKSALLVLNVKE